MPPILIWILAGIVGAGAGALLGRPFQARYPRAPLATTAACLAAALLVASSLTTPSTDGQGAALVAELNRGLPRKVDDATTLTRVALDGGRLTYLFSVDGDLDPARLGGLKAGLRADACRTFGEPFRSGQLTGVAYAYAGTAGDHTVLVEPKDCGA